MKNYYFKLKVFSSAIFAVFFLFLIFGQSLAAPSDAQQQDLKTKINILRNQIQEYQKKIDAKNNQAETLQGDIDAIEKDIAKIQLEMQETQLVIQSLDLEIADKEAGIASMQKEVDAKKKVLAQFMQELYENGNATSVELALGNNTFSDYFFQADSLESFEERTREIYDQFVYLREGIKKEREKIDGFIVMACENWKIERIALVDKNVMRVSIFEMLFSPDVPPKVAIDEAIEMGKKYGNEASGDFINGVLDRILKDYYKEQAHS